MEKTRNTNRFWRLSALGNAKLEDPGDERIKLRSILEKQVARGKWFSIVSSGELCYLKC
jgi:hypothetical protein